MLTKQLALNSGRRMFLNSGNAKKEGKYKFTRRCRIYLTKKGV